MGLFVARAAGAVHRQGSGFIQPHTPGADQFQQRQERCHIGAAAFLRAEQLAHAAQRTFQHTAQHVGHTACHRYERRGDQRFKPLLGGLFAALAAAHQAEPRLHQPVGILFAGIFRRAFRFLGLAHRGVQIPRTAAQLRRHLLAGAVLDQTAGQLRFHAFRFRAAWQQQGAFHLNQVRGHINEFAGDFQLIGLHGLDGGSILLNEFHDIDIIEVHFIFANQIEQQIQRTFKIIFL